MKNPLLIPLTTLISQTQKLIEVLSIKDKPSIFFRHPERLLFLTKELQKHLSLLQHENISHEALYLEKLSKIWLEFKKEAVSIRSKISKIPPVEKNLSTLIQVIEIFPEKTDHSLGFYLERYNQENWSPFPFMELLEFLHKEENKTKRLKSWISLLEEIAEDLSL